VQCRVVIELPLCCVRPITHLCKLSDKESSLRSFKFKADCFRAKSTEYILQQGTVRNLSQKPLVMLTTTLPESYCYQ
jgi:hypothetical protein